MKNDYFLFEKLKKGDEASFETLYQRYKDKLYSYILSLVKDESKAEDVIQELFMYLLEKANKITIRKSVQSMLYRAARNRALNSIRDTGMRKIDENKLYSQYLDSRNGIVNDKDKILLKLFITKLPDTQKEVIHLKIYAELTFKEISDTMGIPEGTASSRYNLGLEKLKEMFETSDSAEINTAI